MRGRRPAWNQPLFPWVWRDPDDDRPDRPDDDMEDAPPPLRSRVRGRHGPRLMTLWGADVAVRPAGPRRLA